MPTYDYECTKCHQPHRANHSMNADKPACPACGGELKQVFLVAPATHGASSGGDHDFGNCGTGACPTGTCPFMQ
jgi:putative FmdB family regulatory protein